LFVELVAVVADVGKQRDAVIQQYGIQVFCDLSVDQICSLLENPDPEEGEMYFLHRVKYQESRYTRKPPKLETRDRLEFLGTELSFLCPS